MKWLRFGLTLLLPLALSGCEGLNRIAEQKPRWIVEPEVVERSRKFVSAVGVGASGPNEAAKLQEAEHGARTELARKFTDYVAGSLTEFFARNPNLADPASTDCQDFVKAVSAEVSNAILRQSLRQETWHDTQRDAFYVLYRVPITMINYQVNEEARHTLGEINPFNPSQEDAALENLARTLNAALQERVAAAQGSTEPTADPLANLPPVWHATGSHPDYPAADFMTAVGLGERQTDAQDSARAELAKHAEVRMLERYRALAGSEGDGNLTGNLKLLGPAAVRLTAGDLVAVRVPEVWYDPIIDVHYALGVLNRDAAAAVFQGRANEAMRDAADLFASASNHARADNYMTAMQEYLRALLQVQHAMKWQLAAMVVQPAKEPESSSLGVGVSVSAIKEELGALLGRISLRKISGDSQWTPAGGPLRMPLVAGVFAGKEATPLVGMPLRFRFTLGSGALQEAVGTGRDGKATCAVTKVEASEGAVGEIQCALAPEALVSGVSLAGLAPPSVTFRYVLRTRLNTCMALYLDERTFDGGGAPDRLVETAVWEALTMAQYNVLERSELPEAISRGSLAGDADAAAWLRAVSGLASGLRDKGFLLLVVGKVQCELVETTDTSLGKLHIVAAPVTIRVIDPGQPEEPIVLTVDVVGQDAFLDNRNEAARRARVKAAELAAQKLVAALNDKFGAR